MGSIQLDPTWRLHTPIKDAPVRLEVSISSMTTTRGRLDSSEVANIARESA